MSVKKAFHRSGLLSLELLDPPQQVGVSCLKRIDLKDIGLDQVRVPGAVKPHKLG